MKIEPAIIVGSAVVGSLGLLAACGSSAPTATPAAIVVCHQFYQYENAPLGLNSAGNPLGTFETQVASDNPPDDQLNADVTRYLNYMQSGGEFPGSGAQEQTAQARALRDTWVAIQDYFGSIHQYT